MKAEESISIKQVNIERVRAFMEQAGSVSKSQISRQLGLSFPTVTRLLDELRANGEILEQGTGSSTGGRCPSFYELNPRHRLYLLIQIESGRICWNIKDLREALTDSGEYMFQTFSLEKLDQIILDAQARYDRLHGIAIGLAALVNNGIVEESDLFGCLRGMNLAEHLSSVTSLPFILENDMNFLTMGCWTGCQNSVNSLVTLFLGHCGGMGGGMMIDRKLWTGASGFCTEPCFLPFMDRYWEELRSNPTDYDITQLFVHLIQIYAATVNPSMVVLYHHPLLEGRLDRIRGLCAAAIPPKALPSIELSKNYQSDYERGLFAMARSISHTPL